MEESKKPSRENEIIEAINDHKGHVIAVQALATAIFRALPIGVQASALAEWDIEVEVAKTVLLNSNAPDDLVSAVDRHVDVVNQLRLIPPRW